MAIRTVMVKQRKNLIGLFHDALPLIEFNYHEAREVARRLGAIIRRDGESNEQLVDFVYNGRLILTTPIRVMKHIIRAMLEKASAAEMWETLESNRNSRDQLESDQALLDAAGFPVQLIGRTAGDSYVPAPAVILEKPNGRRPEHDVRRTV